MGLEPITLRLKVWCARFRSPLRHGAIKYRTTWLYKVCSHRQTYHRNTCTTFTTYLWPPQYPHLSSFGMYFKQLQKPCQTLSSIRTFLSIHICCEVKYLNISQFLKPLVKVLIILLLHVVSELIPQILLQFVLPRFPYLYSLFLSTWLDSNQRLEGFADLWLNHSPTCAYSQCLLRYDTIRAARYQSHRP